MVGSGNETSAVARGSRTGNSTAVKFKGHSIIAHAQAAQSCSNYPPVLRQQNKNIEIQPVTSSHAHALARYARALILCSTNTLEESNGGQVGVQGRAYNGQLPSSSGAQRLPEDYHGGKQAPWSAAQLQSRAINNSPAPHDG